MKKALVIFVLGVAAGLGAAWIMVSSRSQAARLMALRARIEEEAADAGSEAAEAVSRRPAGAVVDELPGVRAIIDGGGDRLEGRLRELYGAGTADGAGGTGGAD